MLGNDARDVEVEGMEVLVFSKNYLSDLLHKVQAIKAIDNLFGNDLGENGKEADGDNRKPKRGSVGRQLLRHSYLSAF